MTSGKGKIAKNTLVLYLRMGLVLVVALYTSRITLQQLGVSDYGTFNVVGGVIVLLNFVTSSLSQGIQRFYNVHKATNDYASMSKVFSASMYIMLCLGLVLILLAETLGLWFLNYKMNIPEERMFAANVVFQLSILITLLSMLLSPHNALMVAHEDFSIYAFIEIGACFLALINSFLLQIGVMDKLILYAFLGLSSQILRCVVTVYICRVRYSLVKFAKKIERQVYNSLLTFSGWTVLGVGVFTFSTQGVNVILNIFFGTIVNAARGIAVQISAQVDQFINNVQTATNPQIVQLYTRKDVKGLESLLDDNFRWNFSLYWLIALPVLFEIDNILSLWLGKVPPYTSLFTVIIILRSLLKCFERPVNALNFAIGDMKSINIFASVSSIASIIIAILLFYAGFDAYWVFLLDIISIAACVVYYMYSAHSHNAFSFGHFFSVIFVRILFVASVSFAVTYFFSLWPISGFVRLLYIGAVTTFSSGILLFFCLYPRSYRKKIANIIYSKFSCGR